MCLHHLAESGRTEIVLERSQTFTWSSGKPEVEGSVTGGGPRKEITHITSVRSANMEFAPQRARDLNMAVMAIRPIIRHRRRSTVSTVEPIKRISFAVSGTRAAWARHLLDKTTADYTPQTTNIERCVLHLLRFFAYLGTRGQGASLSTDRQCRNQVGVRMRRRQELDCARFTVSLSRAIMQDG